MLTGVINSENIPQVLRNISQRRQQGVLEINFADRRADLFFIQGKVVDVQLSDRDHVQDVLEMMQRAGCVPDDFALEAPDYQVLYEQLAALGVDQALFKRVLRHRILDRLYGLDFHAGAFYNFKVQMVETAAGLLPLISVGQLLLDLVSLEAERSTFEGLFFPDAEVQRALPTETYLSEEERLLCELIRPGTTVAELAARSMLSRFHLQESLLALHERGFIRTSGKRPEQAPKVDSGFDVSSIVEALEQSAHDALSGLEVDFTARERAENEACDDDDADGRADLEMQLSLWSARLLQTSAIPHLIVYMFLAAALLMPFFFWGRIFARFGF